MQQQASGTGAMSDSDANLPHDGGAGVPVLAQSFAQWRDAARSLLVRGVAPEFVQWIAAPEEGDLFAAAGASVNYADATNDAVPAGIGDDSTADADDVAHASVDTETAKVYRDIVVVD